MLSRFKGNADTVILTSEENLEKAKKEWPRYAVLTPRQALGLEFKYVIILELLSHNKGDLKVGKLLQSDNHNPAIEGHRTKVPVTKEVAEQEPWLTNLIAASSRATEEIYFVEEKAPQHHATLFIMRWKISAINNQVW